MNQPQTPAPAIVFDFGGVLMDWNPRYLYRQYFNDPAEMENFLAEIGFFAWNSRQDQGYPLAQAVAELSEKFPQHAHLIRAYAERWDETISGPIQPTVEILRRLKQGGQPLFGLSNWPADTFRRVRRRYEFFDWFEDIVVSGEEKLAKPDPRIFSILLERAGRRAADCLFIDDAQANIDAAIQLGFQAIRFESAQCLEEELIRRGLLPSNGGGAGG